SMGSRTPAHARAGFPYARLGLAGPPAVACASWASGGTVPEPLTTDAVPSGQGIVGQLCWIVPRDQVAGLVLYATPPPFSDLRPAFFALSSPAGAGSNTASVGASSLSDDAFSAPAARNASLGQPLGSLPHPLPPRPLPDLP